MPSRPPSLLARALEPIASGLWILFLIWTLLVGGVWLGRFGEGELELIQNTDLRNALAACLNAQDAIWITLAAANVYLSLAEAEGLPTTRRWAMMILGSGALIGAVSVWSRWPLGAIHFTSRLGIRLGPLPLAFPLLWFLTICGARAVMLHLLPRASHGQIAAGTGFLALLTDLNVEPVAWKVRAWWVWYPRVAPAPAWPPVQNYLTWLLAAVVLAFFMRESAPSPARTRWSRPATAFLIFNAMLLLTYAVQWLRH